MASTAAKPAAEKRARVAVVTVPITRKECVRYENFEPGKLNKQRKSLVDHLRKNAKGIEVTDAGDLFEKSLTQPSLYAGGKEGDFIDEKVVKKLGKKVEALKKTHDLVILLGELHTGAVFAYTGEGSIARFDAHADFGGYGKDGYGRASTTSPEFLNEEFNYANYAGKALAHGIFKGDFLAHYGLGARNASAKSMPARIDAEMFDIDLDVFKKKKYKIQKRYDIGVLDVPDVGKHIASSEKINTLGFFEYRENEDKHGVGMRFIKAASLAAAKAVMNRKTKG